MNILEFIRKNSLLVLIVIVGVGAGLVMMDYSGKTSAFSRDYYIQVDGTGYDYAETISLGDNGKEFVASLLRATRQVFDRFDTNGDERFDEQEAAALSAWEKEHPEVGESYAKLNAIYSLWGYGALASDSENVAVNRAVLHAAADALGLRPSEEQIDTYLRNMPAFCTPEGEFNTELYRRLSGFRRGNANRVQEEIFRGVIADIMIWEALQSLVSSDVHFNTKAQLALIDSFTQSVSGRTAWLPADKVPPPAEPTEDELKAYWEEHKEQYKSPERRIVSVYTLTPGADSNMENLLYTADALMQDISQANGQGIDKMLADAAQNPEYDPFSYLGEDGSTHRTYPLSTREQLQEQLASEIVNYDGAETPLAGVAFSEVDDAPTVQSYEEATAAGNAEKNLTIKQIRGFYSTPDGKLKLVRIEAVEPPSVLPYDDARDRALADLRIQRSENALADHAQKLYEEMKKTLEEQNLQTAFALAEEAGAQVESYGPLEIARITTPLPSGVSDTDILGTASGHFTPLAVLKDGARITSVERRTVEDSPAISLRKRMYVLPGENEQLRRSMMQEWLNAAYERFNVKFSEHATTRRAN